MSAVQTKLRPLRLALGDTDAEFRAQLRQELEAWGHFVVAEAGEGNKLVEAARTLDPDIVLLNTTLHHLDGLDAAQLLHTEKIAPVVVLSSDNNAEQVKRAAQSGVFSYLVKPITPVSLIFTLDLVQEQWRQLGRLDQRVQDLEEKIKTRRAINYAKILLMEQNGWKEQDAFRHLQERSMRSRRTMRQVSEQIAYVAHQQLRAG